MNGAEQGSNPHKVKPTTNLLTSRVPLADLSGHVQFTLMREPINNEILRLGHLEVLVLEPEQIASSHK